MGLGGVRQRHLLTDDGSKLTGGSQGEGARAQACQLVWLGDSAGHARHIAVRELALADRREAARRHAKRGQTAAPREQPERLAGDPAANAVKDDVDSPAAATSPSTRAG